MAMMSARMVETRPTITLFPSSVIMFRPNSTFSYDASDGFWGITVGSGKNSSALVLSDVATRT